MRSVSVEIAGLPRFLKVFLKSSDAEYRIAALNSISNLQLGECLRPLTLQLYNPDAANAGEAIRCLTDKEIPKSYLLFAQAFVSVFANY